MYHVSAQGLDERMINVHYDDDYDDDDDDFPNSLHTVCPCQNKYVFVWTFFVFGFLSLSS